MLRRRIAPVVMVALMTPLHAQVCTPGDGDGDADVDFVDFGRVQRCVTGQPGLPAGCEPFDFDDDDDIDVSDVAAFHESVTGPSARFDYGPSPLPNAEAEQVALEFGSTLVVDLDRYERIRRDLAAIRSFQPNVAATHYPGLWPPDRLIVKRLHAVSPCGFNALNAHYGVTSVDLLFQSGNGAWYIVHFPARLKITLLAQQYAALPEIEFAEPDYLIGFDDYITVQFGPGAWTYDIDDGYHDCFDGCDCHIRWRFSVSPGGAVTQLSMSCEGLSWCEFPAFCSAP